MFKKKVTEVTKTTGEISTELNKYAEAMKYYVSDDSYINILQYNTSTKKYHLLRLKISKNQDMIILNDGCISLNGHYYISPNIIKDQINNFVNGYKDSKTIDMTDYSAIYIISDGRNVAYNLASYNSFSGEFYLKNRELLQASYQGVINTFMKIFLDVSNKFDYPEVRAEAEELEIILELLATLATEIPSQN